jgi:hypothetical protein
MPRFGQAAMSGSCWRFAPCCAVQSVSEAEEPAGFKREGVSPRF